MASPPTVERKTVPPTLASVPVTRRWIGECLASHPDEVRETASLLTSELVTNAVLHAATDVTVTVRRRGDGLRVEVADGDPQLPAPKNYGEDAATGRGLGVITALADTWGAKRHGQGKVVWFELGDGGSEPELEAPARPAVGEKDEGFVPMALLGVPVAAMVRAQAFYDGLFREFRLFVEGDPKAVDAIHSRLLALVDEMGTRFAGFTSGVEEAWRRAVDSGAERVDLRFVLPADIGPVCVGYDRLLDEADAFCRAGALMTLAAGSEELALRKWILDQFVRQSSGQPAVPWDESVWAKSLEGTQNPAPG